MSRSRRNWLLALAIAGIGLGGSGAQASWNGASSGTTLDTSHTYTNTGNWLTGTIDDSFPSTFAFSGPTTLYFAADRSSGTLNLAYGGTGNLTLMGDGVTARTDTLNGDVVVNTASPVTITIGDTTNVLNVALLATGNLKNFNVGAGDVLSIISNISTSGVGTGGGFDKVGTGTLILSGTNNYTGQTKLDAGVLRVIGTGGISTASNLLMNSGTYEGTGSFTRALGTAANQVQFSGGATTGFSAFGGNLTVNFGGAGGSVNWDIAAGVNAVNYFGQLNLSSATATGTVIMANAFTTPAGTTSAGPRVINVADGAAAVDASFTGTYVHQVTSTAAINSGWIKTGAGTLRFENTAALRGTAGRNIIAGGSVIFWGAGNLDVGAISGLAAGSSNLGVGPGASLVLDDTGATSTNRISDTSAILLRGGSTLRYIGNASSSSSETMGSELTGPESGGPVTIALTPGSNTQWTLGSSAAANGEFSRLQGTTAVFTGPTGASNQILVFNGTGQSLPANAQAFTPINGIGSPWALFQTGSTFDWVAYSATAGTAGAIGRYAGYTSTLDGSGTENANITGSASISTTQAANSLRITSTSGSDSLNLGGSTLTLASGGLLFTGGANYAITNGTLTAASATEMVVHVMANTLTLPAVQVTSAGLTKSGPGKVVLGAGSTLAGTLTVGQGTLDLNGNNASIGSLLGSGVITNGGGTTALITVNPVSGISLFNGTIQNGTSAIALTKNGSGTAVLAGTNYTFGGPVMILGGGLLRWTPGGVDADGLETAITTATPFTLGTGQTITIDNQSTFVMNAWSASNPSSTVVSTITNGLAVTSNGGLIQFPGNSAAGTGTVFGGPLNLGGLLSIQPTSGTTGVQYSVVLSGTITVDNSTVAGTTGNTRRGIFYSNGAGILTSMAITGPVVDGTLGGGVVVANPLRLSAGGAVNQNIEIFTPAANMTYTGGTVIESGIGTVIVSAASGLGTGPVTINAANATLQLGAVSNIASGVTVTNSGTLIMNASTTSVDVQGYGVSGSGTYKQNGTDLIVLTTAVTGTGATTISAGGLALSNMNQIGTGNLNLAGGVLVLDNVPWSTFTASRASVGTGANQWQLTAGGGGFAGRTTTLVISGGAATQLNTDFTLGSSMQSGGSLYANAGVNISQSISLTAGITRTWALQGGNVEDPSNWTGSSVVNEISGLITGGGANTTLILKGFGGNLSTTGGTLRLSDAANDFTASVVIGGNNGGGGIVTVTDDHALGNPLNTVSVVDFAGGPNSLLTFEDQSGTGKTFAHSILVNFTDTNGTQGGFGSWAGKPTYTGTVTIGGTATNMEVQTLNGSVMTMGTAGTAATISNPRATAMTINKGGNGELVLQNVAYTGTGAANTNWALLAGTLTTTGTTGLNTASFPITNLLGQGTQDQARTWKITTADQTYTNMTSGTFRDNVSIFVDVGRTLTTNMGSGSLTDSTAYTGQAFNLSKTGTGTWIYSTSVVNASTGAVTAVGSIQAVAGTVEIDGSMGNTSLRLAGGTFLVGNASPFSESQGANDDQLNIMAAGGEIGLSPLVTGTSVIRTGQITSWDQTTPTTLAPQVVTFAARNNTSLVFSNGTFPDITNANTTVLISRDGTGTGFVQINDPAWSVAGQLGGLGQLRLGSAGQGTVSVGGGGFVAGSTLTIQGSLAYSSSSSSTFAGTVIDGTSPNVSSLSKQGSSTLTLTGVNNYTGTTSVTAGTLNVNGSLGSTSVSVASNAIFGGTGTVGGLVTVQGGGILAPGTDGTAGRLTVNSLSLSSGSIMRFDMSTGAFDQLVINTNAGFTIVNGTIQLQKIAALVAGTYPIITYSGAANVAGLSLASTSLNGLTVALDTSTAGSVKVVVSGAAFDTFSWNNDASGGDVGSSINNPAPWEDPTNWADSTGSTPVNYPSGNTQKVLFGGGSTANTFVSVSNPITIGAIDFNTGSGAVTYRLQGTGSITLTNTSNIVSVTVESGVGNIQVPLIVGAGMAFSANVSGGSLTLNTTTATFANATAVHLDRGPMALATLTATAPITVGTSTLTAAVTASNIRGNSLTIQTGSTLTINTSGSGVAGSSAGTSTLKQVSIVGSGKLDLKNNDLIVEASLGGVPATYTTVYNYVKSGYNSGAWTGSGITSSTAATQTYYDLAVVRNDQLITPFSTFSGQTADSLSVLVKFTYAGDIDLSGLVTLQDYRLMDLSYVTGYDGVSKVASWVNGDFNFDGKVDYHDYALADAAVSHQGSTVLAQEMYELHAAEFGADYVNAFNAAVPEPASLCLLGLGAMGLLCGRRGRSGPRHA